MFALGAGNNKLWVLRLRSDELSVPGGMAQTENN